MSVSRICWLIFLFASLVGWVLYWLYLLMAERIVNDGQKALIIGTYKSELMPPSRDTDLSEYLQVSDIIVLF